MRNVMLVVAILVGGCATTPAVVPPSPHPTARETRLVDVTNVVTAAAPGWLQRLAVLDSDGAACRLIVESWGDAARTDDRRYTYQRIQQYLTTRATR